MTYTNGLAPIVTVRGPGNLHHLSYNSVGGFGNVVGIMPAPVAANASDSNNTITKFLLGFAYSYTGYAFYWDGAGPAFWRVRGTQFTEPVGTSWSAATGVPWGDQINLGVNVESEVATAVNRDNQVVVFIDTEGLD